MRLDQYLIDRQFFKTRTKAQEAIKAGAVQVNGKIVLKANTAIEDGALIEIIKEVHPYVSRGGLKLEAAIQAFNLSFSDRIVLDIGASTGGFTDCALKHGAKRVYACDVGSNQLDDCLRNNEAVVVMEQTNILDVESLPDAIDYIVMDVSFVSIEKILPAIKRFLNDANAWICLIKPQFEVGKMYLKNGIVKNQKLREKVLQNVEQMLKNNGMRLVKCIPSPILGGSGNQEFLAYIQKDVKC
ncbi:MAG TPA: TlyA family RNA methyltransferase [Candidatus Pelethenecus faecipullorum]|uniref:TlyA family RNA methyltransferase n=1 Tax=Candidatus Pelethenecus faecipullorum TaxID=2840900 RepID=A0A9D1GQY3_9MOLU|nr:TlyA family RNA methyltransferase [Candidatus Pelethenecus faecipullorum]